MYSYDVLLLARALSRLGRYFVDYDELLGIIEGIHSWLHYL